MIKDLVREIIKLVLISHPKDCIFTPNALDKIVENLGPEIEKLNFHYRLDVDLIIEAIQAQEIYCPHEGIDRRSEHEERTSTCQSQEK